MTNHNPQPGPWQRRWRWFWDHFSTWLVLALLIFLIAINVGCERRPSPPAPAPPAATTSPRVVALAPGLAQMVPPDLLVGRHGFDRWSDQAITVCGDQEGIDYEALMRLQPTHVFLQWGQRELPQRLISLASKQGWVMENLPLLDLSEIDAAQHKIDALLMQAGYANIPPREPLNRVTQLAGFDASKPVLIVYQTSPITVLGPGSYHHQLLANLGVTPAIAPSPRTSAFMKLELEDILAIDPWAIIVIQPRDEQAAPSQTSAPSFGLLSTEKLAAFRARRIALIDRSDALIPGPSLRAIRDEIAAILQRFAQIPPGGSTLPPS